MKQYSITKNGIKYFEVSADTEEEAIDAAIELMGHYNFTIMLDYDYDDTEEQTHDRDMYSECERLALEFNGVNLLPLLLAAAYKGKTEGINQTIAKQNDKDTSDREIIEYAFANNDTTEVPYLRAYKLYLQDNNLHDDSYQTTEQEAKEFLLLGLSPKQIKRLIQREQDANNL